MLQDLRLGVRTLAKQPGFTVVAALTLALGIGSTAAVFSLIQGVLLTPPPYPHPDRLVLIPAGRSDGQSAKDDPEWSAAQWQEWQKQSKSFRAIAAYGWTFNFLVSADGSESIEGMWVTHDYFAVTGLQPILGRAFLESEAGSTTRPVILLGYELWQRKFHGDPNILGRKIQISRQDTPPTVVGVMPPGVRFLPSPGASQEPNYNPNAAVDFWFPAAPTPERMKARQWNVAGRLKEGVTLPEAQAELSTIAARQAQTDRDFEGFKPRLESLSTEMNRDGSRILFPLLGAAALVLLIACGNTAALLLVRGLQRQQEYAVRSALGIGRFGLIRQVSAEGLLVAGAGGMLGVGIAFAGVRLFKAIGGHAVPRLDAVTTGWPVLLCGLGAALLAAFLASVVPALRASRFDPVEVLKSAGPKSSAGLGERRLLRGVTIGQTAMTLALLVGAGLLVRTMMNLARVQSGYSTGHILTMTVTAVQGDWMRFHRQALERVSAISGVERAAFAWGVPLTGNDWPVHIEIEGQPIPAKPSDRIPIRLRAVTSGYFDLLGLALDEGRDVRSTDVSGSPGVMIVNRAFVRRYLPHGSPLGKKIWLGPRDRPPYEVIGVAADARNEDLTRSADPEIYLPLWQSRAFSKTLAVRTAADPSVIMSAVERELRAVDPTVAVENVKTLDQIREDSFASRTFAMRLLIAFSVLGSVLTLVGIYGVLSLSVAARRREIAIRAAVGAEGRHIRGLVFAEAFRLVAAGVVVGAAAALLLSRLLRTFLFGVETTDPATFIGVSLLFAGVALAACWVPVRRAVQVDPIEALRYE
jgi:putative ABC transport system permease protein